MKRFAAPDLSGLDSSATGTVRDADSNGDGRLGEFGQRNAGRPHAVAMEAVQSSEKMTPSRLRAPLSADLWRCHAAAGGGRHHRSAVDVSARMTAVVRRLAPGVPFGENLKLSAKVMTSTPSEQIGRMLSGDEASQLILRLVDGRYRPEQ
jgi:hypothetical protein